MSFSPCLTIFLQERIHRFPLLAYATTTSSSIVLQLIEAVESDTTHIE